MRKSFSMFGLLVMSVSAVPAHSADGGTVSVVANLTVSAADRCVPSATPIDLPATFTAQTYDATAGAKYFTKSNIQPIAAGEGSIALANCPINTIVKFASGGGMSGYTSSFYLDFIPLGTDAASTIPAVTSANTKSTVVLANMGTSTLFAGAKMFLGLYPEIASDTYAPLDHSNKTDVKLKSANKINFRYVYYTDASPTVAKAATSGVINPATGVAAFTITMV